MRRIVQWLGALVFLFLLFLLGPISVLAFGNLDQRGTWLTAERGSSGQAPSPQRESRPVVQVYGARTLGRRGAFAIHTWIATKRRDAAHYTVHHVIGWRYYRGGSAVVSEQRIADFKWFGAVPELLVEHRGNHVQVMIDDIERAVVAYPYADFYRVWPGPNSNTFTAFVARRVPSLKLDLPPTAIGKDYLGMTTLLAPAASGTGWQLSLFGMLGVTGAVSEGVEVNLFGLAAGLDFNDFAVRLPGLGRISLWPR